MKSIVSTIFLLAGTFVPSLSETGEHGLGSLRGSEHTARTNNGFEGGRNLEADGDERARTLAARRPIFNDCTIQVAALLEIPGEAPPDFEDLVFECELNPFDAPGGRSNIYKKVQGTKSQMKELKGMLDSGDLVPGMSTLRLGLVEGDADTTEQAELDGNNVKLPQGMQIKNRVEKLGNGKSGNKNFHPSNFIARRRLQNGGLTGQKPILVVKVIDPNGLKRNETTAVIADKIFGTSGDTATLKSQLEACSYDQLEIVPGDNNAAVMDGKRGVYEAAGTISVTIDTPLNLGADRYAIHNDAAAKVEALLGFTLPGPFDQVMFVLEKCYTGCGWAAYAYINSWMSVYQDVYFSYVGTQVHELGHNFGMAHSGGLDNETYTDHTCMMGNPLYSDDIAKMCYNPAKNWYLGWYDNDNTNDRTELINPIGQPNSWSVTRTLVGIADWGDSQSSWGNPPATTNYPVVIKLETGSANDFFLGFNRASGMNAENDEGDDQVTVIETGQNGNGYSQSFLRARMSQGGIHIITNYGGTGNDLEIVVDQIDQNSPFWTANVTIGWAGCATNDDCNPNPVCFGAETCNVISKTCELGPIEPDCCGNGVCDGDETLFTCPVDSCPYGGCADDCRTVQYTGVSDYGTNFGLFFKVQAQNALVVSKLSVRPFTGGTCSFEVWTKTGDFETSTESPDNWIKIDLDNGGNANCIAWDGNGATQTDLPDFLTPIGIQAGQFQSFYVIAQTGDLIWKTEGSLGDVISSNADISMFAGKRTSGAFSGVGTEVIKITGTVTYGLAPTGPVSPPPTSPPTNPPSPPPTNNPTTVQPTNNPTPPPTSPPTNPLSPPPTNNPTTVQPTNNPTPLPTSPPTNPPSPPPTNNPTTVQPTNNPTPVPTSPPTNPPSGNPTSPPTNNPTTEQPTNNPTSRPTISANPTQNPTPVPGYCSDDSATRCVIGGDLSECGCGGGRRNLRALQSCAAEGAQTTACGATSAGVSKKSCCSGLECNTTSKSCVKQVVPTNPPTSAIPTKEPTNKPTDSPTTSDPTIQPTGKPTLDPNFCECLADPITSQPTKFPTNGPTPPATSPPTRTPTPPPTNPPTNTCTKKNQQCTEDTECCNGNCRTFKTCN